MFHIFAIIFQGLMIQNRDVSVVLNAKSLLEQYI